MHRCIALFFFFFNEYTTDALHLFAFTGGWGQWWVMSATRLLLLFFFFLIELIFTL